MRADSSDRVLARGSGAEANAATVAAPGENGPPPVMTQSDRLEHYEGAIERLDADGLIYPCYCTRREIREAASAPHGPLPEGAYPGTCRARSEEHTSELQSRQYLVCRLLLEKKKHQ